MSSFASPASLREPAYSNLKQLGHADLVIGLPTHQTKPQTAAFVAEQAIIGAKTYFPALQTILVNADTGQDTATRDAIQATAKPDVPVITGRYSGLLGRGMAISAILQGALELKAKAIILLDGRTESISPMWIPGLATFILKKQADLVKPRYALPLTDSALSDLMFYPFTRTAWGVNLQHPAAIDCALSIDIARTILEQDVWETDVNRAGFDIWLSIFAAVEGWPIAQAALGLKEYDAHTQTTQAIKRFKELVGTMFHQLAVQRRVWPKTERSHSLPTLTQFADKINHIPLPDYDPTNEIEALALGWIEYRSLWQKILPPPHLEAIEHIACLPEYRFFFPPDLWAKVVYDFAVVYNKGELDPDAVVTSLYPLYLGRLAGFWPEIAGLTAIGRAGTVSAQGVEFEEHRFYLKKRWDNFEP